VWVWSIVHQSVPGVQVPYVVGIVDLPEGVSVRCNLIDVEPDPGKLRFGMPVEMTAAPEKALDVATPTKVAAAPVFSSLRLKRSTMGVLRSHGCGPGYGSACADCIFMHRASVRMSMFPPLITHPIFFPASLPSYFFAAASGAAPDPSARLCV